MLKIGTVKWRGRCSKHPGYDPSYGGEGAIKANCERCHQLLQIYAHYIDILRLMRAFQPIQDKSKPSPSKDFSEFQQSLFS
jgi:hypothetical protein